MQGQSHLAPSSADLVTLSCCHQYVLSAPRSTCSSCCLCHVTFLRPIMPSAAGSQLNQNSLGANAPPEALLRDGTAIQIHQGLHVFITQTPFQQPSLTPTHTSCYIGIVAVSTWQALLCTLQKHCPNGIFMPDSIDAHRGPSVRSVDSSPQTRLCLKVVCKFRVWWLVWTWRTWGSAAAPLPSSLSASSRQTSLKALSNMSRHAQPSRIIS